MERITQPDLQGIRSELADMVDRIRDIGIALYRPDTASGLVLNRDCRAAECIELLSADLGMMMDITKTNNIINTRG